MPTENNGTQNAGEDQVQDQQQQDDAAGQDGQSQQEQAQDQAQDGQDAAGAQDQGGDTQQAAEGDQQAAQGQEQPKPKPGKPNPFRNRISELTSEKRTLAEENAALRRQLEEAQRRPTEQQADDQGEQQEQQPPRRQQRQDQEMVPANMVTDLARQEAQKIAAKAAFDTDCNAAFTKGVQTYGDFEEAMANFNALGGLEQDVIEDALATGFAHQVLYDLGNNAEEAARILKLPRGKRIAEFTKMTIKTPAKAAVSRAPAPIRPVGGNAKKDFDPMDTSIPDDEWHRQEDAREAARRQQRA